MWMVWFRYPDRFFNMGWQPSCEYPSWERAQEYIRQQTWLRLTLNYGRVEYRVMHREDGDEAEIP